jgi:four helix bundle protein
MRDHRKLEIFVLSDQLVVDVYELTQEFPKEEIYGLVSQLRRSAVSVPTNIVEGCGRKTELEFDRFLDIAFGSVRELGYLIDLSGRLGFLSGDALSQLIESQQSASGALAAFIRKRSEFQKLRIPSSYRTARSIRSVLSSFCSSGKPSAPFLPPTCIAAPSAPSVPYSLPHQLKNS